MQEVFVNLYDTIMNFIASIGIYGPLLGSLLIVLESIIPILPLFVFITLNTLAFGKILGFLISWICTVLGCILSYSLVRKLGYNFVQKHIKDTSLIKKFLNYFKKLSISQIVVILAIPFTPAFMMNIAAGLANIPFKKYLVCLLISKIFLVLFWGEVGTGLIESFKHPQNLIIVGIMVLVAYILSLVVKKVFKLD